MAENTGGSDRGGGGSPGLRPGPAWAKFLGTFWPFVLGCVFIAGGIVAIVIGYVGVSGTVYVGLQIPYLISGAALGLALVIVGTALLVVQVLTRQTRLLRTFLGAVDRPRPMRERGRADGNFVLVAAGASTFHRPSCLLVEGKSAEQISPQEATDRSLTPCPLCDPVVPAPAG